MIVLGMAFLAAGPPLIALAVFVLCLGAGERFAAFLELVVFICAMIVGRGLVVGDSLQATMTTGLTAQVVVLWIVASPSVFRWMRRRWEP